MRAWDEAEAKEKADIARVTTKASEKSKAARLQRGQVCGTRKRRSKMQRLPGLILRILISPRLRCRREGEGVGQFRGKGKVGDRQGRYSG